MEKKTKVSKENESCTKMSTSKENSKSIHVT